MLRSNQPLAAGLLLGLAALTANAQTPPASPAAPPARRPFASPDTPRQTERIREADIKHIKAELVLDGQKQEVRGTVTHTLSPLHPYLTSLDLDCGPKLKVSRVTVGPQAAACKFATKGEKLSITFDKPYGPDDTVELAITYSGSPESGLHFVAPDPANPEKPLAIWTQGEAEDNHHWLPCYDYPNDRVTTEMIITVARPLSVVSNGALVDTKENCDGTRTFHWKMDQPLSTYLITLTASEFVSFHDRVGNLPVDYYVTKNVDEATARRFMGKTPAMIRFFNDKTGQTYPYCKYAQICLPEFGGGMENTSATSMTDAALLDEIEALERRRGWTGRPRAGPPVVRRSDDLQGLVAHLAQRGIRLLLRPTIYRTRQRCGRVPAPYGRRAQGLPGQRPDVPPPDRRNTVQFADADV